MAQIQTSAEMWAEAVRFDPKAVAIDPALREAQRRTNAALRSAMEAVNTASRSRKPGKEQRMAEASDLMAVADEAAKAADKALRDALKPIEDENAAKAQMAARGIAADFLASLGRPVKYVNAHATGQFKTSNSWSHDKYEVYEYRVEDEPAGITVAVTDGSIRIGNIARNRDGDIAYEVCRLGKVGREEDGNLRGGAAVEYRRHWRGSSYHHEVRWQSDDHKTVADAEAAIEVLSTAAALLGYVLATLGPVTPAATEED